MSKKVLINEIICENQYGKCGNSLLNELKNAKGKNLFSSKSNLKEILSLYPSVKDYSIYFKYPSGLKVNLIERKAKFAIREKDGFYIIDREGVVIIREKTTSLPYLEFNNFDAKLGHKIEERLFFALNLIFDIHSLYKMKQARVENGSLRVELEPSLSVIFPLEGDRKVLVGSLNLILNQLNTSDNNSKIESMSLLAKTIDLRFKNPVIK